MTAPGGERGRGFPCAPRKGATPLEQAEIAQRRLLEIIDAHEPSPSARVLGEALARSIR